MLGVKVGPSYSISFWLKLLFPNCEWKRNAQVKLVQYLSLMKLPSSWIWIQNRCLYPIKIKSKKPNFETKLMKVRYMSKAENLSYLGLPNSMLTPTFFCKCDASSWSEPTHTLVPRRQEFRYPTRNGCMGWFTQINASTWAAYKLITYVHAFTLSLQLRPHTPTLLTPSSSSIDEVFP